MSCCGDSPGYDELDEVSKLVATKLAAFLRTLRDSGFAVGPREGQDAASLMAAGYAEKPGLLRSAFKHLFSARKTDWDRFDGLFDAFWLGKRVRSRSLTVGSTKAANSPSLKSLQDTRSQPAGERAPPIRSPRPTMRRRGAAAKAAWKAPRAPTIFPKSISARWPIPTRSRRRTRSRRGWQEPCARG